MEIFYGYCLTILEMTFILAALLILHGLRKILGSGAFLISTGVLLVFSQIAGTMGLALHLGYPGLDYQLSTSVLTLPFLAVLLVVYVTDGTLEAQRLIIAMMTGLGLYVYLALITQMQSSWPGYELANVARSELLSRLLQTSIRRLAALVVSLSVVLFLLPVTFQRLVNLKCRPYLSLLGTMLLVQLVDHVIYVSVACWGTSQLWEELSSSYLSRALFVTILSIPTQIYLSRIKHETPGESRRTFDIILAFFGAYGRSLKLEQSLKNTQERYRLLVQNASDMIVILDDSGIIVDANRSALTMFGFKTFSEMIGKDFETLISQKLPPQHEDPERPESINLILPGNQREVELTINEVPFENDFIRICFGRDISERKRLEREREEWSTQMAHRQRIEAIGRLAGGIAHDFNNYLHAIQGHLDIIKYMCDIEDQKVQSNLEKIDHITELAAKLTSQMLSFARKGTYQSISTDLRSLVNKCADLFLPSRQSGISFSIDDRKIPSPVKIDPIQIQQALMNLMINAKDAMKECPESRRRLTIRLGTPESLQVRLQPPPDVQIPPERKFCIIRVEDSGPGIDPAVRARIFEPFFTTKPIGEGTGMGLAMTYGTMLSHNGWVQCENLPERGAAFDLVLPLPEQNETEINFKKQEVSQ